MSEHKYNEAYSKGYKDGQKAQCLADAIDDALAMLDKLKVTNGNMIKAMFPDAQIEIIDNTVYTNIDNGAWFSLDWWNAPYKKSEG